MKNGDTPRSAPLVALADADQIEALQLLQPTPGRLRIASAACAQPPGGDDDLAGASAGLAPEEVKCPFHGRPDLGVGDECIERIVLLWIPPNRHHGLRWVSYVGAVALIFVAFVSQWFQGLSRNHKRRKTRNVSRFRPFALS
jgi:hypothetical protein